MPRAVAPLALWGGVECTVNRVGDAWFDQMDRNGHAVRPDDLDAFAGLGLQALRFPVLWEKVAPAALADADWSWPDARLARMRVLGLRPIVGLLHHGSGPSHTSLVDPAFPGKLAAYAAAVAARYPWIEDWTPVNEPLTTARFSGLYGLWYPHGRDEATFWRALANQCRATVLAMRAIRAVVPGARLVQTEDLGRYWGSSDLQDQVAFNNAMRWLSWDLLCGRVDAAHPLHGWLRDCAGAGAAELEWFLANPCPPDVIGANHYVTSERWLDTNLAAWPARSHGGNGRQRYADMEAARCFAAPAPGLRTLLLEAWQRYGLPIAVTELHLDSTREDQMRWLLENWRAALAARDEDGVDVLAVTVWSLLGTWDWNCLLVECRGYYEPGAFDIRGSGPRPTGIARLAAHLAAGRVPDEAVLQAPGWWHRGDRFMGPPTAPPPDASAPPPLPRPIPDPSVPVAPLLVTGATGTLGGAFARICAQRGIAVRVATRAELDIADAASVAHALERVRPWAVVNTAGYVRVDEAEHDVERCFRENTLGPHVLATECARRGIALVSFSSDLVFDGARRDPYDEGHPTSPLSVYGRSKAEAESRVLDTYPQAMVVRTSSFFGPWDVHNFVTLALTALRAGRTFAAADDLVVSPTYVPDLVHACLDLLIDGESGLWHLTNGHALTWAEFARRAAAAADVDASALRPRGSIELGLRAPRPSYSALHSRRGATMPTLDDALRRWVATRSTA
ncbi:MAG: NAD-dependent epimerase/dehydratase family protein [Burkholderiales bacterium]|nr:MAG: NAD-dependent epimerase/dehydratase family protein [Burkholderiales bacterium]